MLKHFSWTGAAEVAQYLKQSSLSQRSWKLRWKPVCASTERDLSRWLLDDPIIHKEPRALISDSQKFGKGQYDRTWISPKGGVWISAAFPGGDFLQTNQLFGLSVAVSLAKRIESMGLYIKVKWPNDLIFQNRKLAGVLPKLFYRGTLVRMARVGVGLNVSNRVPIGAISLSEILGYRALNSAKWSAEVLIAIERSIELLDNKKELCNEVEKRLWAREFIDPETGSIWEINGIDIDGGLKLSKGSKEIVWQR